MWKRYVEWEKQQRQDYLQVLLDPTFVEKITQPTRRRVAKKLTELSRIERMQFYQFLVMLEGSIRWKALIIIELVFCSAGAILCFLKPKAGWLMPMIVTNVIGWVMLSALIGIWFNYRNIVGKRLKAFFLTIIGVVFGLVGGSVIGALYKNKPIVEAIAEDLPGVLKVASILCAVYLTLIGFVAAWRNQTYETINVQLELEAEREKNARQSSETQLRLLRAQIEPHFLFNTLGAVQQLAEDGAPKAAQLTANLIVFLRASISEMRSEQIPLRDEFAMIRAYLEVMQVRIGQRLQFQIDLPEELAGQQIPSMMLLTLAENAIKHGIEPSVRGGEIHIQAKVENGGLLVQVSDSGVGLKAQTSAGIGLQNVRDRLRLAYGGRASLTLCEREEGGVAAQVRLPLVHAG